ncbi:MAG: hypothetical protein ABF290_10355 [Thiogranum sp.]
MKLPLQTLLILYSWAMTAPAVAEAFQTYATVVNVQPIVETFHEPVTRRVCTDPDDASREFSELSPSIGEDIRSQHRLWQARRSCNTITERQARERISAYRVTYRYRGYTATTQLSYHPGERMPVNVSLSPLP